MTNDEILKRLIKVHISNHCKCTCDSCDQYESEIETLVLDVLEVPADNTVETNAAEIATTTGVWPEGVYCRDWAYQEWDDLQQQKKPNAEKFIAHIRTILSKFPN